MYSLYAIFALIPLIFSHTFARFGEHFIIDNGIGNFESVKMHLFLIGVVWTLGESCIYKKEALGKMIHAI